MLDTIAHPSSAISAPAMRRSCISILLEFHAPALRELCQDFEGSRVLRRSEKAALPSGTGIMGRDAQLGEPSDQLIAPSGGASEKDFRELSPCGFVRQKPCGSSDHSEEQGDEGSAFLRLSARKADR